MEVYILQVKNRRGLYTSDEKIIKEVYNTEVYILKVKNIIGVLLQRGVYTSGKKSHVYDCAEIYIHQVKKTQRCIY